MKQQHINVLIGVGVGMGVGVVLLVAGKCVLCCCGFRRSGVEAGSCAASMQGPNVESGSPFACAQSVGAAGVACAPVLVFLIICGIIGGVIGGYW